MKLKLVLFVFCLFIFSTTSYSNSDFYDKRIMELDEQLNSIQKKGYAEPGVDIDELYEKRHKWLEAKSNFLQGKEVDPNYMPKSKRQELIEELFLLQIEKSNLEDYGRLSIDKEKEIDARTKEIRLELEALRLIQD